MSDFIRREDVVEALYQAIRTTLTGTFTDSMSLAIAMANNIPSAELEERTAKVESITFSINPPNYIWKCSKCGQYFHQTSWGNPVNYCSSCGAKLKWK